MRKDKLSPDVLDAARVMALASIDENDDQGLRDTLQGLRDRFEPYQYREIDVGIGKRTVGQEPFKGYVEYLDDCLSDLIMIDAEEFDQATVALIQHLRESGRLSKLVRQPGDGAKMRSVRAARKFDPAPVESWCQRLPPARKKLSVSGLANWMLDNWDSELEGIKPPSERTLRRILTTLRNAK